MFWIADVEGTKKEMRKKNAPHFETATLTAGLLKWSN